jgi:beta-glucanase (GH16 family)
LQWPIGKLKENKYTHRYGYYECRCRLQQQKGWWSAFWLQSPIIGASLDPKKSGSEVDIMESFKPGVITSHNVFTGGYGLDMQRIKVGGLSLDEKDFHTFGVLWLPDKYVFYVDGKEDGVMHIFNDNKIPPMVDLRVIYGGNSNAFLKDNMAGYTIPSFAPGAYWVSESVLRAPGREF